ncbi:MAG: hypothetical protein EBE86_013420 [Hormoscilla sp. GUM202]|nr:hypothetical protein [Hormoscilla sp. GUM202]
MMSNQLCQTLNCDDRGLIDYVPDPPFMMSNQLCQILNCDDRGLIDYVPDRLSTSEPSDSTALILFNCPTLYRRSPLLIILLYLMLAPISTPTLTKRAKFLSASLFFLIVA